MDFIPSHFSKHPKNIFFLVIIIIGLIDPILTLQQKQIEVTVLKHQALF